MEHSTRSMVVTPEKIDYIKRNYRRMTAKVISEELGISRQSVERWKGKLGLRFERIWTEEEKAYIREHYPYEKALDIAAHFGVMDYAVRYQAKKMGISKARPWTDDDVRFLRENWGKVSVPRMAKALDRTVYAATTKIHVLGLNRRKKRNGNDD